MTDRKAFDESEHMRATHQPMAEPDLFSQPATGIAWPAPSVRNDASEAAADELTHTPKGRARREHQLVTLLETLAKYVGGLTRHELAHLTGISLQTVCARVGFDLGPRGFADVESTLRRDKRQVVFISEKGRSWLASQQTRAA